MAYLQTGKVAAGPQGREAGRRGQGWGPGEGRGPACFPVPTEAHAA